MSDTETVLPDHYLMNEEGFIGVSPKTSFYAMSDNQNLEWPESANVGTVLGFLVFGIAMLITVVWIFIDIKKMDAMYADKIEEDKAKLQGFGINPDDLQEELNVRLAGKKEEDKGDDQLMGEASRLDQAAYSRFM